MDDLRHRLVHGVLTIRQPGPPNKYKQNTFKIPFLTTTLDQSWYRIQTVALNLKRILIQKSSTDVIPWKNWFWSHDQLEGPIASLVYLHILYQPLQATNTGVIREENPPTSDVASKNPSPHSSADGWRTFILWKNPPKCRTSLLPRLWVWETKTALQTIIPSLFGRHQTPTKNVHSSSRIFWTLVW